MAEYLLGLPDIDVNKRDAYLVTPLIAIAARSFDLKGRRVTERLLAMLLARAELDVNAIDGRGRTALSTAAAAGFERAVRMMLARPDLNVTRGLLFNSRYRPIIARRYKRN